MSAPLNIAALEATPREALIAIAGEMGVEAAGTLRKSDLIFKLLQTQAETRGNIFSGGFLEVSDDGNYGFLRGESMLPGAHDIYVSQSQLRRFALRPGDYVTGQVRTPGGYPYDETMTVFDAISLAGGVTEKGSNTRLSIRRLVGGQMKEVDAKPTDTLKPGDQVNVKPRRL